MSDSPWYRDGLRFRCDGPRCTDCCSGKWGSGRVHLDADDVTRLARHLDCDEATFLRLNARRIPEGVALLERHDHSCVFHEPGFGCRVYEARPRQCRGYPFWPRIIASQAHWEAEALRCPGIDAEDAEIVAKDEIERRREFSPPREGD